MEEIISYIMNTPENTNGNILREKLQEFKGSGGDGSVLMVTDNVGTLDKTMGEIQDAYLLGKQVIIMSSGHSANYVIEIGLIAQEKSGYSGWVETHVHGLVDEELVITPMRYSVWSETEEAARNVYPVYSA